MINLLPPEIKEQYIYGRRNVTLRRWAIALGMGLCGVVIVTFAGLLLIQKSIVSYRDSVASSQAVLKQQNLDETRASAKEMTGTLKLAVDVLSHEILFSKLLTQIAKVTPSNTNLTDLTITSDQNAIDVKAISSDYGSATQIQVNLQDPANKIFDKADIQSISCNGGQDPHYPCAVTIKALFNQNNPYLFINKGTAQ